MKKKTVDSRNKNLGGEKEKMKTKNKLLALAEIAIVLCSVFLVALPAIAADQNTQKTITTASEDNFTLGIYGNANEDDIIDMRDTTYIKLVIFGKKPKTDLADANYDGKISMLDVGQTKLIILGKEKKLTVGDLFDRTVTINKPVERIVLTFGFEEPIAVMGEDIFDKIVGWNRGYWEGRRQSIWEKYTSAFPEIKEIPDLGYPSKGTFNIEEAIILKPDIVIMVGYEYEYDDVWKKLEQVGIPTIFVDYHKETIETHAKSTLMLGYVFDKEQRAQEIVDFYTEQVNIVYSRIEEIDKPKPKVYLEGHYKKWAAYGNWMWGATIEDCGGINIAKDLFETGGEISPEYVLDANPDVIIVTSQAKYELDLGYDSDPEKNPQRREVLKRWIDRPGWDTLNAVKYNRVYSIHHGLSRHIYDFVGVQCMAKCIYPDEFEDLDPEESWKEFHEKFLPVDYSGVWMMSLEEE